ncbi:MAG TPA: APC family permease [Terriglobia bacterium]|nr:APC family permease [Terriglobia bacterium]
MPEPSSTAQSTSSRPEPHLRRVLTLWDLIFYGIVLIQPIAPVPLFGVAQKLSNGYFVTTIFVAMLAMMITAVSYGRMASLYPAAGSAYTYVGRGLNPHLGFLAGWAMILDYILQPVINTVWISTALHARYRAYHIPQLPFVFWAAIIVAIITILNLRGVKTSAAANKVLLAVMFIVVGFFIYLAVRYLFDTSGWSGVLSTQPFYDPATFNWPTVMGATSFAALTYIGFDGVTTLSEEVENPKRNVLLATVLTCIFAGVFSALEVYLGARVWPNWQTFPNLETAFMDVCRRVGGLLLFHSMGIILIVAAFGSALTGGMGAARLLFGMGRDNVLPRRLFGHVGARSGIPTYSIVFIAVASFGGAVALNYIGNAYEHAGETLNFGAFLAFMGVNFATFWQFAVHERHGRGRRIIVDALLPLFGFAFCGLIWWNLNPIAKKVGAVWFALGLVLLIVKTRGFREKPVMIDFGES